MGQLEGITTVANSESSSLSITNYGGSLHEAATKFDTVELARLIKEGCQVNDTDGEGRTALHVLLADEFRGNLYGPELDQCLQTLLDFEPNKFDINLKDDVGETPLSLAVLHGFQSAALALVRNGADTAVRTTSYPGEHSLASEIGLRMPQVMMAILDAGITHNSEMDKPGQTAEITLDWRPLLQYDINNVGTSIASTTSKGETKANKFHTESSFLYSLLDAKMSIRSQYLEHPLVSAFLHFRISETRRRLRLLQAFMALYPIQYLLFVSFMYFDHCRQDKKDVEDYLHYHYHQGQGISSSSPSWPPLFPQGYQYQYQDDATTDKNDDATTDKNDDDGKKRLTCKLSGWFLAWGLVSSIIVAFFVILDVYMLAIRRDLKYLASWRVWVMRASYVTLGTTFWGPLSFYGQPDKDISWIYPVAALGTFVAFPMLLLQLETVFPPARVHLEMLAGITVDVLKIILLFIPLLGGFYLGFSLMYSNIGGVLNFVLMVVDIGSDKYDELRERADYSHDESFLWFTTIANGFRIVFIVVISVVFLNFMMGVTIGDIPKLKANARVLSRSQKVQAVFLTGLFLPNKFNLVSPEDMEAGKWTLTYQPSNKQCLGRKSIPVKIRKQINEFIKAKRNQPSQTNEMTIQT